MFDMLKESVQVRRIFTCVYASADLDLGPSLPHHTCHGVFTRYS